MNLWFRSTAPLCSCCLARLQRPRCQALPPSSHSNAWQHGTLHISTHPLLSLQPGMVQTLCINPRPRFYKPQFGSVSCSSRGCQPLQPPCGGQMLHKTKGKCIMRSLGGTCEDCGIVTTSRAKPPLLMRLDPARAATANPPREARCSIKQRVNAS